MKKVFIAVTVFLAISTQNIFAAKGLEKFSKENISREIIRSIRVPDFITENSAINEVRAIVQVDKNGLVKVFETNSANEELKQYVLGELKKIRLNTEATEKFVLVVKFRID